MKRKKMTVKERVLKRYHGAEYELGCIWYGWFSIGAGKTARQAWADAARRLK